MRGVRAIGLTVFIIGQSAGARACPLDLPVVKSRVNGQTLKLEVAKTESERQCGLSGRPSLAENRGMLFVLPRPTPVQFWMKDVKFPLAIAFLDEAGKILEISVMTPDRPKDLYPSPEPVKYVIETNREWFARHAVKPGDVFELP